MAHVNRVGMLNVMKALSKGGEIWLDDVMVDGRMNEFARDRVGRRGTTGNVESANVRPRFDFGLARRGMRRPSGGELGGLVFPRRLSLRDRLAAYGDRLALLTLDKPLKASGKVSLHRAVSDTTILLRFLSFERQSRVNPSQASGIPRSFLGSPWRGRAATASSSTPCTCAWRRGRPCGGADRPRIHPDRRTHDWTLTYDPRGRNGPWAHRRDAGRQVVRARSRRRHRGNRCGASTDSALVTTWIDGNGQHCTSTT